MNDLEKAAAEQLAALLGTSVSAATAHAVTVALDVERRRIYTAALVEQITADAIRTAASRSWAVDEGGDLLVIYYPTARIAYGQTLETPVQRPYDDAIAAYCRQVAEGYVAAGLVLSAPEGRPQRPVLFSFNDQNRADPSQDLLHLLYYGDPLPWVAGSFTHRSTTIAGD